LRDPSRLQYYTYLQSSVRGKDSQGGVTMPMREPCTMYGTTANMAIRRATCGVHTTSSWVLVHGSLCQRGSMFHATSSRCEAKGVKGGGADPLWDFFPLTSYSLPASRWLQPILLIDSTPTPSYCVLLLVYATLAHFRFPALSFWWLQ